MGLYPRVILEYLTALEIPRGPDSNIFLVDTEQGLDTNLGDRWTKPLLTPAEAYDRCVADQHDTVLFLARDTAAYPSATITWDKDHTHLIGLGGALPGVGQRCRIVGNTTNDLVNVISFAGKGNIVRNMQFFNGADADVDSGAALITGDRLEFSNVFFAGMGHTTPAARAGSHSLKLTGSHENIFKDCAIGLDTILRADANAELVMNAGSSKNVFQHCKFMSYTTTAGKFLVQLDVSAVTMGLNTWEDCLFYNNSINWANFPSNAFNIIEGAGTYFVDLVRCRLVGVTGWADVVTHIYSSDPVPAVGFGIPVNPTT